MYSNDELEYLDEFDEDEENQERMDEIYEKRLSEYSEDDQETINDSEFGKEWLLSPDRHEVTLGEYEEQRRIEDYGMDNDDIDSDDDLY